MALALASTLGVLIGVPLLFFLDLRLSVATILVLPASLIGPRLLSGRATQASYERGQLEGRVSSTARARRCTCWFSSAAMAIAACARPRGSPAISRRTMCRDLPSGVTAPATNVNRSPSRFASAPTGARQPPPIAFRSARSATTGLAGFRKESIRSSRRPDIAYSLWS